MESDRQSKLQNHHQKEIMSNPNNGANERNVLTVLGGFIPFAERFQKNYAHLKTVPELDASTAEMVLRGVLHEMTLDMNEATSYLTEQIQVLEDPASIVGGTPGERKSNAANLLAFFEQHLEFARQMQRMFGVEPGPDNGYTRVLERAVECAQHHVANNQNSSGFVRPFNLISDHKDIQPPVQLRSPSVPPRDSRRTTAKHIKHIKHIM